jgi:hypothetical protein
MERAVTIVEVIQEPVFRTRARSGRG